MFIALEGIDGSGKTTLSRMLSDTLRKEGHSVYWTREPTKKIKWNEKLRRGRDPASGVSLFFRFTEDRFVHQDLISRHLDMGEIVICDRYLLSSYAYQGAIVESAFPDRGSALGWMEDTSSIITLRPDITVYLDLPPEISMERLSRRSRLTGFEEEKYLNHVRELYNYIEFPGKITIDSSRKKEKVFSEILEKVNEKIRQS